jgi:EKC/KEOPS complex subunit CGI121/TPRKB
METYTFPHFPSYATPIHIALFNNVSNSSGIRKKLIEASTMEGSEGDAARDKVDFGFVDASLVRLPSHKQWRRTDDRLYPNSI